MEKEKLARENAKAYCDSIIGRLNKKPYNFLPGKRLKAIWVILFAKTFLVRGFDAPKKDGWSTNYIMHNGKSLEDLQKLGMDVN